MSHTMRCPRPCTPRCDWTGETEAALIEHYIEVHHSPTEDAYKAACIALRRCRAGRDLEQEMLRGASARIQRLEGLLAQVTALDEWQWRLRSGSCATGSEDEIRASASHYPNARIFRRTTSRWVEVPR